MPCWCICDYVLAKELGRRKNDYQSILAQTQRKALLPSNLTGLHREISGLSGKA